MAHAMQVALEELIDTSDFDFEIQSYSAKGMQGRMCLSAVFSQPLGHLQQVEFGESLRKTRALHQPGAISSFMFLKPKTPLMGKSEPLGSGTVVYWPQIPYEPEIKSGDLS